MAKSKVDNESSNTLEIIRGISKAASNIHDGARTDDGKGDFQEIGLRREEKIDFRDRRLIDGFGISLAGNILTVHYQSEISLKEVYENKFEDEIVGIIEDCVSFLKKEYRAIMKKSLNLKMIGEPKLRVERTSKVRSWVTAYCNYEIGNLPKNDSEMEIGEDRLKAAEKAWVKMTKKNYKDK